MANNENLQTNPFFAALLDHIPDLEANCVKNNWILCIPQAVSLPESHRLSLRLLKTHILIPASSINEFKTLNGVTVKRISEKELEIQNDDNPENQKRGRLLGFSGCSTFGSLTDNPFFNVTPFSAKAASISELFIFARMPCCLANCCNSDLDSISLLRTITI